MGYNGSNRRPKFDVGSKRDAKRMNKLVADIITAPLSVGTSSRGRRKSSSSDSMTRQEEYIGVLIVVIILTPIFFYFIIDLFRLGHSFAGIITFILLIVMWWIVYLAKKAADKDK